MSYEKRRVRVEATGLERFTKGAERLDRPAANRSIACGASFVMLWLTEDEMGYRPTARITDDILCCETIGWCEGGNWQVMLFDMVSEAQNFRRVLKDMVPGAHLEVGTTAAGEALVIVCRDRTAPLSIQLSDMRVSSGPIDPPQAAWDFPASEVLCAATTIRVDPAGRSRRLSARMVREAGSGQGLRAMREALSASDPHAVSLGSIDAHSVVAEIAEIMEGLNRELELDETRIVRMIEAEVGKLGIDLEAIVERVAHRAIQEHAQRRAAAAPRRAAAV